MTYTISGRSVNPQTADVPTLLDIGLGLMRASRFGGQTFRRLSVLDHSTFAAMLAIADQVPCAGALALFLHDAHEAVTGDVPTPWKTYQLSRDQAALDRKIMDAYFPGGYGSYVAWHQVIQIYDRRTFEAESLVFRSARTPEGPRSMKEAAEHQRRVFGLQVSDQTLVDAMTLLQAEQEGILCDEEDAMAGTWSRQVVEFELVCRALGRPEIEVRRVDDAIDVDAIDDEADKIIAERQLRHSEGLAESTADLAQQLSHVLEACDWATSSLSTGR